jgi:hypothetical protein
MALESKGCDAGCDEIRRLGSLGSCFTITPLVGADTGAGWRRLAIIGLLLVLRLAFLAKIGGSSYRGRFLCCLGEDADPGATDIACGSRVDELPDARLGSGGGGKDEA